MNTGATVAVNPHIYKPWPRIDERGVQMHHYGENHARRGGLKQDPREFIRGVNLSAAMAGGEGVPLNA